MRRSVNSGIFALTVVGLYYLYRNRDQVQSFLEQNNIRLPLNRVKTQIRDRFQDITHWGESEGVQHRQRSARRAG